MISVPFENIHFNAEAVCKHKTAKAFIAAQGHQYFAGREGQEAMMTTVYNLCREAIGDPVKATRRAAQTEAEEEPAPINPDSEGGE